jgi:hypothetical protein
MTASVAVVDYRNGEFYVQSWDYSAGRYPMLWQGIWLAKIEADTPTELGAAVRAALAHSRSAVEHTPAREAERAKSRRALLKLAGVRGETQYQTGLSEISVKDYAGKDDLEITVYDNPDPRENMTPRPGRIYIPRTSSDEELGAKVHDLMIA